MIIDYYGFEIKPVSSDEVSLRVVMLANAQIPIVPDALINMAVKRMGEQMVKRLLSMSADLRGTRYEEKMKDPSQTEFYRWMRRYVEEYCRKQGWSTDNLPHF